MEELKSELKALLAKHDKATPKKGVACSPELANELIRNRDALVEAMCANCCACHAAGYCPDE